MPVSPELAKGASENEKFCTFKYIIIHCIVEILEILILTYFWKKITKYICNTDLNLTYMEVVA